MVSGPPAYAIESARRLAESLMTERCVVRRLGAMVVDDDGYEHPEERVVYEGKCKINSYESYEVTPTAGEHRFTMQRYQVHLPYSAEQLNVDDVVRVDGYRFEFRVVNDFDKTYASARRYFVVKVVD